MNARCGPPPPAARAQRHALITPGEEGSDDPNDAQY
jgi:hypothetical protein